MATFTEIHGISLAENSYVENFHVEILTADPVPTEAGKIWYNSTDKQYKSTTYDAGGAVIIQVLGGKEQLDQYILDLASQTRGEGSALVGYAGKVGTNGEFSVVAGTAEASLDALVQGIDNNAQALVDLGNGSLTNLQNEIDAIETSAGLNIDGTYTADATTNYLAAAAGLKDADKKLDAQVKANADALVQEVSDRAAADALKVDKAGDSMTGDLSLSGNKITNLGAPLDDTDAANKVYVDNAINGISWKAPVKAATTANITLSGTQTIDGVVLAAGDRVLVKDQTILTENGIYDVVDLGAWTRSTDFDDSPDTEVEEGAAVFVEEGTVNGDNGFTLMGTNTDLTPGIQVGTDELTFIQFSGAGQIIAGAGISKIGNEIFLNFGAGIKELPSDEIGIEPHLSGGVMTTLDGATESTDANAQLAIKLDGTTLETNSNGLKITDAYTQARVDAEATIQNELDATQVGAGLDSDGGYTATVGANYVGSAGSLDAGIQLLDAQVKTNEDGLATEVSNRTAADAAIQTELDAVETGAGLGTDGTYTAALSANYINASTSLFNADTLLDTQLKTTSDALAQEVTDRTAAVTSLTSAINNSTYTFESTVAATSHTITHNLADAFVTVAMWVKQADGTYKNDIGQITLNTNSQLTVDLTVAKNIRVVVTASKDI